ncbi:MAG: hypothetical protein JWQ04_2967 [Pedosphaera sp.]|nr:hypothetical protein [Pedosphaera sp.]
MKTKPTKLNVPRPDYQSRAAAKRKESAIAGIETVNGCLTEFETICGDMANNTIRAANKSREVGLHLLAICDREQLSFEYWQAYCQGKIKCSFEQAKRHVSTAHKIPKLAKTIEEAAPFIQTCLFAANLLEVPERIETHNSVSSGPIQKFFSEVTILRRDFEKAIRQLPMENWNPSVLHSFVKDSA